MKFFHAVFTLFMCLGCHLVSSQIEIPGIFSDNMVIQRNANVDFWGWANAGEELKVITGWDNKEYAVKTNSGAKWSVSIDSPDAGGPYTVSFKGKSNEIVLENVLVGDIWLCSGQSNMQWSANSGIDNKEEAIKNADYPNIRFFSVDRRTASAPQENLKGNWEISTPETMANFSAIAYFFAQRVQGETGVPIGLINASWGGTPAEVWTPAVVFEENDDLIKASKKLTPADWWPIEPSVTYNAMIAPITKFKIAGALWYQGESNTSNAEGYKRLFTNMIGSWRSKWGQDFPFYYVQIAPYNYETPEEGVMVRDQQRRALEYPNTGMVVISDICTVDDIHPRNKKDVGLRLANLALKNHYKVIDTEVYGPLFKAIDLQGGKIEVVFDHAEGLYSKGKKLTHFEVAGEEGQFFPAQAIIKNGKVLVSSKEVKVPTKVRYAWSNTALPNLFNKAGLPASSFISE